jgi:RNA polymerase sigma-70 factor (ECF subfamily)
MDTALTTLADVAAPGSAVEGATAEDFDELVRLHQRRIYRVLFALVRDHDLADNLTQECFLRAYRKWHTFRGEARVETWLIRIAVNLARDHGRNRRWQFWRNLTQQSPAPNSEPGLSEAPDPGPTADRSLLAREQVAIVRSILQELPYQQRSAFTLRFFEEMTLEEVARSMGVELGTVKAHLFRAVSKVRKALKEQNEQ